MPEAAFYLPDGDGFVATEHTRGPWDERAQHAGPPCALIAHVLEAAHPRADARMARITVEILRPVAIGPLRVTTEVARGGRNVELLAASLSTPDGPAMLARAWRIRTAELDVTARAEPPPPAPGEGTPEPFWPDAPATGWHTGVEARFTHGAWRRPGPAGVWFRARRPLLPATAWTPLARVLLVADAGNGVSGEADPGTLLFVNTDLTVACHRLPVGEWIHVDARTWLEADGTGLAASALSDERGLLGRGLQSLFVAPVRP